MLRAILNISLRAKIMAVLFVMSAAVLAVATYDSYDAHRAKSRGAFLRKHYERFDAYRKGAGGALNIASAFIATDPDLIAALAANDGPGAVRVFARAESALRHTSAPDLVILVDRGGDPLDVPGAVDLSPSEAASSALLADVRSGQGIDAELAVFGGVVYQVSAAPVRTADDTTVGGIVLGEPLTAYLADYQEQSDPDVTKQHRLTLLSERGTVLSSVFSEAKRPQLATSLDRSNWGKEDEGTDKVDVIRFDGHTYDFYRAHVRGYTGSAYTDIGAFYLMRIRDFKNAEFDDAFRQSALLYLAVLVLSLILGWFVSTWITRPIARYIKATEDLARGRGDLTKRLDESNKDELGQLAHNLNQVFGHIHDLAAKVQRAALQVGASSAEISAASKQMLEGAQEQARKTESSTAAVTELSTSIQQVAENALEATRVAKSSGQAVQSAIERMNEIRATVEEAASKIGELGESGKRIGNIVEVIRQISDQTTLLALNAAIEAAHAGEQGRGFAVVADEVSSLAKRVGQSARDIEDLIATIKEQTTDAVKTMTEGTREVEAGTKLVTATLADLQKLVQVVEDTANAVQEQAVASDEIARNMDAVQRIAQDVLGSSEEAVAQGDHLHRLAHGLEESVKGFRIDDTASSASDALPARSARALPEPRDEKKG